MAPLIENNYVGDGTTVSYSFTFPYLEEADIHVSLDDLDTTEYILANATTIQFNTAPANGVAIRIYRVTAQDDLAAVFYPGSAIRAQDLNDNFTQNLFVTQESSFNADVATAAATAAKASAQASASSAQQAATDASQAQTAAAQAISTANAAESTANTALATANQASLDASDAQTDAQAALNAVSAALDYVLVSNVAAIPSTPSDGDAVEVIDSTGIESFTPLTNLPAGFVGDPGLYVRIIYRTTGSAWQYIQYGPNDPDARYLAAGDNVSSLTNDAGYITLAQVPASPVTSVNTKTGAVVLNATDVGALSASDIGSSVQAYDVDTAKTDVQQRFTAGQYSQVLGVASAATLSLPLQSANNFATTLGVNATLGQPTTLPAGMHGTYTITQDGIGGRTLAFNTTWKFPGGTAPSLSTAPGAKDVLVFYVVDSSQILCRLVKDVK